jgi:hypothetical protein
MEKQEPNTPKKTVEANGYYQFDAEAKRIVAPQGSYLSAQQVVELLNVFAGYGQLLYDIHTSIEVVMFGKTAGAGELADDDETGESGCTGQVAQSG